MDKQLTSGRTIRIIEGEKVMLKSKTGVLTCYISFQELAEISAMLLLERPGFSAYEEAIEQEQKNIDLEPSYGDGGDR